MIPGKQLKDCALRIQRAGKVLSSEAYDPSEDSYQQMESLEKVLIPKARKLLDDLKQKSQPEDTTPQVLLLDANPITTQEET